MNSKALLALLPALLLACGGGDDPGATGGAGAAGGAGGAGAAGGAGGTGGTGMAGSGTGGAGGMMGGECIQSAIIAKEANNYSFTSDIQLTPIKLKSGTADITVDWSQVTTDFLGHTTDPMADIDSVLFVVLGLTVDEFEGHLNLDDGTLKNFNQGALQLITENMVTSGNLQDFIVPDTMNTYKNNPDVKASVDEYLDPTSTAGDPTNHIIAVMPSEGTVPGAGSRMIQVFTIDPAETNTTITLKPNSKLPAGMNGHDGGTTGPSMSVTYDVDLTSLTPVMVPAAKADLSIDWADIMTNGLDREWLGQSIYKVSVGHYTQTLAELETQFLDLETIASKMYSKIVLADEPMPLSSLTDEAGNAFTGIDGTGTWVLALFCDPRYCGNPAPWYLTVLKPCN